jgi:prevent-host-death family protein
MDAQPLVFGVFGAAALVDSKANAKTAVKQTCIFLLNVVNCTDCTLLGLIMPATASYGLEQARIQLPSIVANAHSGTVSVITKHGKPYAAVVSIHDLKKSRANAKANSGLLALLGTGQGLWGTHVAETIGELRDEWGDA